MSLIKKKLGNGAAKEMKLNDDIQLIMEKHKEMPFEDIRPLKIEIFFTEKHIAGFYTIYELINQKKKNNIKRKISDKITFEFDGHKSKGSKFFGVKSGEVVLNA